MQKELRALIARHCGTLADELGSIRGCLDGLNQPEVADSEVIAEGIEYAHKIKGSSGSIGFAEISAAAASLEHCFRDLADNRAVIGPSERERIFDHYDHLAQLISTVTPEQSSLFEAQFPAALNRPGQ